MMQLGLVPPEGITLPREASASCSWLGSHPTSDEEQHSPVTSIPCLTHGHSSSWPQGAQGSITCSFWGHTLSLQVLCAVRTHQDGSHCHKPWEFWLSHPKQPQARPLTCCPSEQGLFRTTGTLLFPHRSPGTRSFSIRAGRAFWGLFSPSLKLKG